MRRFLFLIMSVIIVFGLFSTVGCKKERKISLDISQSQWDKVDNYGIEKVIETPNFTVDKTVKEEKKGIVPFDFFTDGMVLQRNAVNRVFGTADYDGGVAVEIGDKTYYGVAEKGKFTVYLPPVAQGENFTMTIYGENSKVTVKDVCYGEVILFSGQSNMNWRINNTLVEGKQFLAYSDTSVTPYIPNAEYDPKTYYQYVASNDLDRKYVDIAEDQIEQDEFIRLMLLDSGYSLYSIGVNSEPREDYDKFKRWQKADNRESIIDCSMFAFYFAKNLRKFTGVPVGVVVAAIGATNTSTWVDRETYDENEGAFPDTGESGYNGISLCYNTFIAPMLKYKVGSYIWYQGEGECASPTYTTAFSAMVNSYRQKFDSPNMKVLVVSLPQFGDGASFPTGYSQETYAKADKEIGMENATQTIGRANQQKLPALIDNCALSVSLNTGDFDDIHPSDKIKISYQATCSYLTGLYGFKDEVLLYPEVEKVEKNGSEVKIYFKNLGKGLNFKNNGIGFQISENGKTYRQVKAKKSGDCVILNAADVKFDEVNYIRYGYLLFPRISRLDPEEYVSVFNSYGMPLDQFQLDVSNL